MSEKIPLPGMAISGPSTVRNAKDMQIKCPCHALSCNNIFGLQTWHIASLHPGTK